VFFKPISFHTVADKDFIANFKFYFERNSGSKPRGGGYNGVIHDGVPTSGGRNWRNDNDNGNSCGNQTLQGDLYQNGRFSNANDCNSGGRSYNASNHMANFGDCSPSRERDTGSQDYDNFLKWRSQNGTTSCRSRNYRDDNDESNRPTKC